MKVQESLYPSSSEADDNDNENSKFYMKLHKKRDETITTLINNLSKDKTYLDTEVKNIPVKDMCHLMSGVKNEIMETLENPSLKATSEGSQIILDPSETLLLELKDSILDQVELNKERATFDKKK